MSKMPYSRKKIFGRRIGTAAKRTVASGNSLSNKSRNGGVDEVSFYPSPQAEEAAGGIVGMKSGKNKMPGQRGLDGYLRCFLVPDFSNHDNIGVVAQNRTQSSRKCQADFALNLNLIDALKLILHGVLRGDDFSFFAV
jgi:hypothetical protein